MRNNHLLSFFNLLFGFIKKKFHCRYVIFYLPFDFGYKALKFLPIKMMCEALKEVYRAKQVHDGVGHAAKLFPNAYLVMVIIGTVKGNGDAFMRVLERLVRGLWTPEGVELIRPSL